jgi:altered-inheritance-of-mitochondria protein 13
MHSHTLASLRNDRDIMGAGHSRSESENTFYGESPIEVLGMSLSCATRIYYRFSQFSQDVVNQLADQLSSPNVPAARQTTLDAQVRSKIQEELSRLREEEENVREEIERTLEKENLDKERSMAGAESEAEAGGSSSVGNIKSGPLLLGDVDEVRKKVDRFHSKRELDEFTTVHSLGEEVATCYKYVNVNPCGLAIVKLFPETTRRPLLTAGEKWRNLSRPPMRPSR